MSGRGVTGGETTLTFWGAADTVTGSKFLLETAREGMARPSRVLLDCGLFQGPKQWRLHNWDRPPFLMHSQPNDRQGRHTATHLDAVVLTHAHLDHTGWLPRLLSLEREDGGPAPEWRAYATPATVDLLRVMLTDSAHIQEEDAAYANKRGISKHHPALPLYTTQEAYAALRLLRARDYDASWEVAPGLRCILEDAGHLLGSATARFTLPDGRQLLFSGDVGRYTNPLLRDPTPPTGADLLVMESTYGGRNHSPIPPEEGVAAAVEETVRRGGVLVVPAFAVGRTQDLLYAFRELMLSGRIPEWPIYVDSPMAVEATRLFLAHEEGQDPQLARHRDAMRWSAEGGVRFTHTRQESQALNDLKGGAIIIAASGMATAGRVLHHLKHRLPSEQNVVLLVGFQAPDTRGRLLLDGAKTVKIHGEQVPVRAQVRMVDGFSAHADQGELLRWLGGLRQRPQRLFLVHGEPAAATALQAAILEQFGWRAEVAHYGETVAL